MHLGSLSSFIADAQAAASNFINKSENYIISALSNFRDKRGQLRFQIAKLQKNAPRTDAPESLKMQYSAALAAAQDANAKAEWVGRIADEFTNVTGLGVLPAVIAGVPVAVMLAAIAGLTVVIYNAVNQVSRYIGASQAVSAAQAAGRDPVAALAQYNATAGSGGLFGDAAKLIWPLVLAGGVYLLIADKRGRR